MSKFQVWLIQTVGGVVPADILNVTPDIKNLAQAQVDGAVQNIVAIQSDIDTLNAKLSAATEAKAKQDTVKQAATHILHQVK